LSSRDKIKQKIRSNLIDKLEMVIEEEEKKLEVYEEEARPTKIQQLLRFH